MYKRLICTFLIIFLLVSFIYTTPRARAVTILGISGVVEVVIDPLHIATTVGKWLVDVGKWIVDTALRAALATLKKRLLDSLVDNIITWVQGGGDPLFIQDPRQFFSDAVQSAAGDTAYALGLGNLCTQPLKLRLKLNLVQPVFSQRISCTLDKIVGNVQAFRNDFRKGSWIAYQESLKPHNNQWGLQLLVQDELLKQQGEQADSSRYEASAGGGFLGQKRCNQWVSSDTYWYPFVSDEVFNTITSTCDASEDGQTITCSGREEYLAESPDGFQYTGKTNRPGQSGFRCTQPETITPGRTVGDSVAEAIGSDINWLLSSEDLSAYVAAIVDAAINRIAKESVQGLAYLSRERENRTCADLEEGSLVRQACENYESARDDVDAYNEESRNNAEAQDTENQLLSTKILLEQAQVFNDQLVSTLGELITCQDALPDPVDIDAPTKLTDAETRTDIIISLLAEIDDMGRELSAAEIPRAQAISGIAEGIADVIGSLLEEADQNLETCENA